MARRRKNSSKVDWDAPRGLVIPPRAVRQLRMSPEYAAFLANELGSDGYAKVLVRHRLREHAQSRQAFEGRRRALAQAVKRKDEPAMARTAVTTPEYGRLMRNEISSRTYARSLVRSSRLEEIFMAPSREPSRRLPRSRIARIALWWFVEVVIASRVNAVRLGLSLFGLSLAMICGFTLLAGAARDLLGIDVQGAWSAGFVGVLLLTVTLAAAISKLHHPAWIRQVHSIK